MSLSGTGSVFPTSIDSFPLVKDGSGSSCLYSPSTFNKLGDALYNLETHCFTCLQTNTTRYFLTFTASATITEETESIDLSQWFYGMWERGRSQLKYPDQSGYTQSSLIYTLFPGDSAVAYQHGELLSSEPSVFLSVWGNDEIGNPVLCEGAFRYQKIIHKPYTSLNDPSYYAPSFEVGILPVPHTINATGSSLVVDGSFETSGSTNWTLSTNVVVSNTVKAYHGVRALHWKTANGTATTAAKFVTVPGSSYILRFATGCSSGLKTSPTFTWAVSSWNSSTLTDHVTGTLENPSVVTMNNARWHPFDGTILPSYNKFKNILPYNHFHVFKSRPMVINDDEVSIGFTATNASGILLDDVRFIPVYTEVDETTGYEPVRNLLPAGTYEFKLSLGFLTPVLVVENYSE